jgi:hypothetical protein
MERFATKRLYASDWIRVVTRSKNPDYRFRNILCHAVKQSVNAHKLALLIS